MEPVRQAPGIEHEFAPMPHTWSRTEFFQLNQQGYFHDQKVELLGGEIFLLSPQDFSHAYAMTVLHHFIADCYSETAWVRYQLPLHVEDKSYLEPDVSVVSGSPDDYLDHPEQASFVAEISSSSIHYDRGNKGSLYAKAEIPEYWIVNLQQRQVEIYTHPQPDATQPSGFGYADKVIRSVKESVAFQTHPEKTLEVKRLFR